MPDSWVSRGNSTIAALLTPMASTVADTSVASDRENSANAAFVMQRLTHQLATLRKRRDEVASEVEHLVHAHLLWPVMTGMPGRRSAPPPISSRKPPQSLRFRCTSRRPRRPRPDHPTLRLVYPWRTSLQTQCQRQINTPASAGVNFLMGNSTRCAAAAFATPFPLS